MDELQLEEQQKNIQQRQDEDSYDPNAASRFPDGYTSVGEGVDNTQVEEVDPANVGAVEVTNPQVEDFRNLETLGSSGGVIIDGADLKDISPELLNQLQITPIQNASLDPVLDTDGNIINTVGDIPDSGNEDQVVDPEDPEDPDPEDPEDPDPEDPEDPDPEDPDPEDPDPEDPDPEDPDPEDPEDPDPEDPEDPDPEDPEDPDPEDPEDPDPEDPDPEDPNGPRGNNGWGNGDDDAPGNSGPNNGAENDETPGKNYDKLVEKFLENHSFNDEYDNRGGKPDFEYDDYVPEDSSDMNIPDVSEPVVHFDIPNYSDDYGAVDFF